MFHHSSLPVGLQELSNVNDCLCADGGHDARVLFDVIRMQFIIDGLACLSRCVCILLAGPSLFVHLL